ncbi:MAG: Ku protein [Patescibacteria group bacterium]|jgi:DNA end-binding protein Ku
MKAFWKGALVFGLIEIPVSLFDATKESPLSLSLLHQKDLCRVGYTPVCKETGKEVPREEIVRGYEYQKGSFVVLADKDLQKVNVVRPKTIEIVQFTGDQIPFYFFDKPYILQPAPEAERQYALLRESLKRSGKVAVARFVPRTRERLGVVKVEGEALYLNQIRFNWELRKPEEFKLPGLPEVSVRELDTAVKLIDYLGTPFQLESYEDSYVKKLSEVIDEKTREKLPTFKLADLVLQLEEALTQAQKK